jgi:cytochrome c551/c552
MKTRCLIFSLLLIITTQVVHANPIDEGKAIFSARCAACHNINKQLTGPALAGVDQRHPVEWIIKFVHSSQTLVKGGDKDAVALFERFNKIPMPDHPDLTEDNIRHIVEYIKSESKLAEATTAPFSKPGKLESDMKPMGKGDIGIFGIYLLVVGVLIVVLLFGVRVNEIKARGEKKGNG